MIKITTKITSGCEDEHCPSYWNTDDPNVVGVMGTDAQDPTRESVVFIPRSLAERGISESR